MDLSTGEIRTIQRARRAVRFRSLCWLIVPAWLVWIALIAFMDFPGFEIPLPTLIMLLVVIFAMRPVVDARVLEILDRYLNEDSAASSLLTEERRNETVA